MSFYRKLIMFTVAVCLLLGNMTFITTGLTAEDELKEIQIIVDGELLVTDPPPIIEDGRTLVPLRAVFESLEAEVAWDGVERKVTATKDDIIMILYIGNTTALINGEEVELDVPPRIIDGRTMVPIRFVSEGFRAQVSWDGFERIITVMSEGYEPEADVPDTSESGGDTEAYEPGYNFELDDTAPDWVITGLTYPPLQKEFDSANIYLDMMEIQEMAEPSILDVSYNYEPWESPELTAIFWATGCDYSPYVTFQGNQDGAGGCIGRSMVHIMNIMKERELPYTPDVSFWYLHSRQEELAEGGPLNTKAVLEDNGICPEAYAPSDYDKMVIIKSGDEIVDVDYSEMAGPNGWTNAIAANYRMKESPSYDPTIENIRYILKNIGPALAAGDLVQIQGEDPKEGHAVTVVGYDDVRKEIKCLNSWSDVWGPTGDGYFTVAYEDLAENFSHVKYYEIIPVDRVGTTQDYSARIHIETGADSRNKLKVTIGLDDKSPFTVWDTPNETVLVDYSKTLKIDVPLPLYASENWPPEYGVHWYVEVVNNSTWDTAEIKEITFARLYKKADGSYGIETFESPEAGTILAAGETKIFFIPKKKTFELIN